MVQEVAQLRNRHLSDRLPRYLNVGCQRRHRHDVMLLLRVMALLINLHRRHWVLNQVNDIGNLVPELIDDVSDAFIFDLGHELRMLHFQAEFVTLPQEVFHRVGWLNLKADGSAGQGELGFGCHELLLALSLTLGLA